MINKIIATSGTMGYGNGHPFIRHILTPDLFDLIVTKTLTTKPTKGNLGLNPFKVIKPINEFGEVDYFYDSGVVNAVGLTNNGIDWWIKKYYPTIKHKEKIIVSVTPDVDLRKLDDLNIHGIEINFSCPNDIYLSGVQSCSVNYLLNKIETDHSLYLKLNVNHIVNDLSKVEAISYNSIPWKDVFPFKSPLAKYGGGAVSGEIIHHMIPTDDDMIIKGIWSDMKEGLVGIGSVSFMHPMRVRRLINERINV